MLETQWCKNMQKDAKICKHVDKLPWELTTVIFKGCNPHFQDLKPSFFMVLGSQGSYKVGWFSGSLNVLKAKPTRPGDRFVFWIDDIIILRNTKPKKHILLITSSSFKEFGVARFKYVIFQCFFFLGRLCWNSERIH